MRTELFGRRGGPTKGGLLYDGPSLNGNWCLSKMWPNIFAVIAVNVFRSFSSQIPENVATISQQKTLEGDYCCKYFNILT